MTPPLNYNANNWIGWVLVVGYFGEMCLIWGSPDQQQRCLMKERVGRYIPSREFITELKNITVRIIHAGGREEQYRNEIPASMLMEKYPGFLVARPEVFKRPHESLLSAEEELLPGHKYYMIPFTTVQKLQRDHSEKRKVKKSTQSKEYGDAVEDWSEESVCSAKDFYFSQGKWAKSSVTNHTRGENRCVPPIQKSRMCRSLVWEPSLTSIQEISP